VPVSPARIAANRANARHSTGPRSASGKAVSSRNSRKHGFRANFVVPATPEFTAILEAFRAEHQPMTLAEECCVQTIAASVWKTRVIDRLDAEAFATCTVSGYIVRLHTLSRYRVSAENALVKALNRLLTLKDERSSHRLSPTPLGFVRAKNGERRIHPRAPSMPTPNSASSTNILKEAFDQASAAGVSALLAVSQRTREIGVRMALGARRASIVSMVLRQGLAPALAGTVLGMAGTAALTRLLATFLYGISPTDLAAFAAVSLLFLMVAAVACFIPARQVTSIDPLALRQELPRKVCRLRNTVLSNIGTVGHCKDARDSNRADQSRHPRRHRQFPRDVRLHGLRLLRLGDWGHVLPQD
jgi:hypothetical protein